jgi:signal transduction histidine kinase
MTIFLFFDITHVRECEKNLLETKFKNIFLSSFSHNLKTPLNSLSINNEILERRFKGKDPCTYDIIKSNKQNLTLINN